jgi:hypothetical protein
MDQRQQFVRLCGCGCGQPTLIALRNRKGGVRKGQPSHVIYGHQAKLHARPIADRFWEKVNKDSQRTFNGTQCWEWLASTDKGYGQFGIGHGRNVSAHRLAYELVRGAIPDGLTLDHLCRNTICVNPDHLEPVTMAVNVLRGDSPPSQNARRTHCKRGHPFNEENTCISHKGRRTCRVCRRMAKRKKRWAPALAATEAAEVAA